MNTRVNKMEAAYLNYDFGLDVEIVGANGWEDDGSNDYVRKVFGNFIDSDKDTSELISFHVVFKEHSDEIEDVYALLVSNGNYVGEPHSKIELN